MWKWILLIVGFLVGCGVASSYLATPIWLIGGVLGGCFGLAAGLGLDARRFPWLAVCGVLGTAVGAPLGCALFWFIWSSRDSFSGGGLAGMTLGLPVGAVVGCAVGIWLGVRHENR